MLITKEANKKLQRTRMDEELNTNTYKTKNNKKVIMIMDLLKPCKIYMGKPGRLKVVR